MNGGGAFMAGSIVSRLVLDTTAWNAQTKAVVSRTARLGTKLGRIGATLSKSVTLPLTLLSGVAVKTSANFEQKLVNAFSVTGSKSEEVKQQMSDLAREMGATTVFSATEAADAMYYMASAGWKADDMANALKDTLDLAAATQTDLAFATETTITTLNQFQLGSDEAGRVTNVFAAAISNSQATMDRLGVSMSYAGPIMKSMGYTLEETTAILMQMYESGIKASTAGTALRMAMNKLQTPTERSSAALERMGLTFEEVNPETVKFSEIMDLIGERMTSTKDITDLFGTRASAAMAALASKGGGALREFEEKITGTQRATEMADMQVDTFKGSMDILTSALTEAGIAIGNKLAPTIRDIADKIRGAIAWFNGLSDSTKTWIVKIGVAVAAIGPLLAIFGKLLVIVPRLVVSVTKLGGALKFLTSPLGAVTAGFVLLAAKTRKWIKDYKDTQQMFREETVVTGEKMGWFKKAIYSVDRATAKLTGSYIMNKEAAAKMAEGHAKFMEKADALYGGIKLATKSVTSLGKGFGKLTKMIPGLAGKVEDLSEKQKQLIKDYMEGKLSLEDFTAKMKEAEKEKGEAKEKADDLSSSVEGVVEEYNNLNKKLEENLNKTQTWTEYLSSIGLKTMEEKDKRVEILEGHIEELAAAYREGAIDLKTFIEATNKAKSEIEKLSETITMTAVPAARFSAGQIAEVYSGAVGEMETRTGEFKTTVKEESQETTGLWGEMADGLQTKWSSTLGEVIRGTTSLKDGLKGIWDSMLVQFTDMIGQMVAKWATDFIGGLLSDTKSAVDSITGFFSNIFGGGGAGGGGGLFGAATGAAGATPWGAIAMGAGSFLGTLLGGGGGLSDSRAREMLHELRLIKLDIQNQTYHELTWIHARLTEINDRLGEFCGDRIPIKQDAQTRELRKIQSNTKSTSVHTNDMVKALKKVTSAQGGAAFTGTELAVMHGTPAEPEIAAPAPVLEKFIAVKGRQNVILSSNLRFNIEVKDQIDPHTAQRITRDQIVPQVLDAFEVNESRARTRLEEILKIKV